MKNIFFSILLVFISFFAIAQNDYVVTLKGDTIRGEAFIYSSKSSLQSITLKNGKKKERFMVYEIKSLLKENEVYHTIKVGDMYQLGLLIKQGYLSLYKYRDEEVTASSDFSTSVLLKVDGSYLTVSNIGFKKYVSKYLNDCEIVRIGFEKNRYKKSDLNRIIDDYNFCIAKKSGTHVEQVVASQNPDKLEQIKELIYVIKKEAALESKEEIIEMLTDLNLKIKTNTKVPTYLKNALRDSLKENKEFTSQLNKILG